MKSLESEHVAMHTAARKIVELKEAGKTAEAEAEFRRLDALSQKVVALLRALDKKLTASAAH